MISNYSRYDIALASDRSHSTILAWVKRGWVPRPDVRAGRTWFYSPPAFEAAVRAAKERPLSTRGALSKLDWQVTGDGWQTKGEPGERWWSKADFGENGLYGPVRADGDTFYGIFKTYKQAMKFVEQFDK